MFSRLFKTPKSSLQLFRKNQAAMLPNDAESPQFPSENFSSLPIIWKVGLGHRFATRCRSGDTHGHCPARALAGGVAVPAAPSLRAIALRRMRPRSPNRIGHDVLTSHIETCWSRGFRVNETLRRKFTCVAAYFFVRQDPNPLHLHPIDEKTQRINAGSGV